MFSRIVPLAVLTMALAMPVAWGQEATRVATCNPGRVFDALDETKAIQKQMTEERNRLKLDADKRRTEIVDLQQTLRHLKPGSPQYVEKSREARQKAIEFNVFVQVAENEVAQTEKDHIRNLYRKIQDAVREVALERKIDLVLTERKPQIPEDLSQLTPDQLRALIIQNDVLFANEKVDITEEIVLRLNKKYAAGSE